MKFLCIVSTFLGFPLLKWGASLTIVGSATLNLPANICVRSYLGWVFFCCIFFFFIFWICIFIYKTIGVFVLPTWVLLRTWIWFIYLYIWKDLHIYLITQICIFSLKQMCKLRKRLCRINNIIDTSSKGPSHIFIY